MPKVTAKVSFHKFAAAAFIRKANEEALRDLSDQALEDIGQYVPEDQGTLKGSGLTHSDRKPVDGVITLRWDTPYAQYLWHGDVMHGNPAHRTYGPEKLTFTAALAREEWAKYAYEVHGGEWEKVYQAAMKARMR